MKLPAAFISRVYSELGDKEAGLLIDALHTEAPVSLRMNRAKTAAVPSGAVPVPWCDGAYYQNERPFFTSDPVFHAGGYYVQEASSMFVEMALRAYAGKASLLMLDLCAAPGGKSTLACSFLPAGSLLVANEVNRLRAQVLVENLTKWGKAEVVVTNNDPADFRLTDVCFDIILVDAPCSGEGMFRKVPLSIKEWSTDNILLCQRRQRRILHDIWSCLKPGGIFIYSTCTFNLQENEENVRMMRDEMGAIPLPVPGVQTEWGIIGNLLPGEDFPVYRFMPHRTRGEGFFMAVLRKPGGIADAPGKCVQSVHGKKHKPCDRGADGVRLAKSMRDRLSQWLKHGDEYELRLHGADVYAFPRMWTETFEALRTKLRVVQAGVPLAVVKGGKPQPAHALAMSIEIAEEAFPRIETDREKALAYLCREVLVLPPDAPRGFVIPVYEGMPLGFVKNIGSRANNLYPQEWRIRMNVH